MRLQRNAKFTFEISKKEQRLLYCFLWLQIIHTTYFLLFSGYDFFYHPYWSHSIERLGSSLIVMVVLAKVHRGIHRGHTWAWEFSTIIALNVLCFAIWHWRYEDPIPKIILGTQLVLLPVFLFVLLRKRIVFKVTMQSTVKSILAIVLSIAVIYLRSEYYATNQINWAIDPPFYFKRLVYSNFHWPHENSLALMFVAALMVNYFWQAVTRRDIAISS